MIIVHGYTASPQDHWFEWLRGELADAGIEVLIPPLSDSTDPVLGIWVAEAAAAIEPLDESTVVIGHSLGVITALHPPPSLLALATFWGARAVQSSPSLLHCCATGSSVAVAVGGRGLLL